MSWHKDWHDDPAMRIFHTCLTEDGGDGSIDSGVNLTSISRSLKMKNTQNTFIYVALRYIQDIDAE